MGFREIREADHAPVTAVVDKWWGGRPVADKLPRLFFRLFRETSFVVEEDGDGVDIHSDYDGDGKERVVFRKDLS